MRFRRLSSQLRALAALCVVATSSAAPEAPAVASNGTPAAGRGANDASISTRKDARTITLRIPAPRGQIVDREGEPMAQNVVAYQVALQFKQFENPDRDFIVNWGRTRIDLARALVKNLTVPSDDEVYDHYRNRRWLPLILSEQLSAKEAKALESKIGADLVLHPVYRRFYPEDGLAAHVLGFTGSVGKLPTGPINFNEPYWEEIEGRAGLEKIYDKRLIGEPGTQKLLFDESGNKLLSEETKRPRTGGTVVSTLNVRWQRLAEKVLKSGCKRGAFVVIDAVTGDVLVMASKPTFSLNTIDTEYKNLDADPTHPMVGLAYQGTYPPASTFKPIVALAALNNGTVGEDTQIYCPAAIEIGNHVFNNWNKNPEGEIDVKRAIARSCNPWFYQVGIKVGPNAFLSLARRLGYGEKTGLPLLGENSGLVPNNEWFLQHEKRRILDGDTANLSIGQGVLLASPLQVAQAMAGIANGGAVPKLQLVRQVQDDRGRVVEANRPERRVWLGVDPVAVDVVRKGMRDVVNAGYGTGKAAQLSFTEMCGKTGTAQWGPASKEQRLAWFAGFFPFDNPRYSFAVLYEGRPGETVSGGRMAAPMVKAFFEPLKDEIKETIAPPPKAVLIVDDEAEAKTDGKHQEGILKAIPVEPLSGEGVTPSPNAPTPPDDEAPPLKAVPVDPKDLPVETDDGP
ncbi:penicillin-binding transpeptidase domain-containing protein [Luteolibacter sp. LG18]|uniref:peptidoglycan D,D-transpeptidase FtsI family protein n=1 Tax=Luteolibacter sp. LG18 TaxID=2819286 RepID=UPI0030C6CCD8